MPTLLRVSGLCVLVSIYVTLFILASVILVGSFLDIRGKRTFQQYPIEQDSGPEYGRYSTKYYYDFSQELEKELLNTSEKFSKVKLNPNVVLYSQQDSASVVRWPYSNAGLVNCSSLHNVTDLEFVAGGWTKAVYKGRFGSQDVAIKTVNLNGHDIQECQKKGGSLPLCYRRAAAKIMKEIILLNELTHDNIVKVLGSCVPDAVGPVALVTELGNSLDTVGLLQLSWEDRLRLALGMAQILHHLAHSSLGSLSMNDFRRQQFVLVDGTLKLSDVDDIGVTEPKCEVHRDCSIQLTGSPDVNLTVHVHCVDGQCKGHNEKLNIWHAGKHFIRLFLPINAPSSLEPHIQELLHAYRTLRWDTSQILAGTQRLLASFVSGDYLQSSSHEIRNLGFEKILDSDLPGMFDYRCHHSISSVGCVKSVFNEVEAAEECYRDPDCKAVVLGQDHSWTGRTLAIFKNGYGPPTVKLGYSLLLRKT